MPKNDYSRFRADEVTEQYGDLLEKQMNILRDKKTGTLRTLFNVAAFRISNNGRDLHDAVLQKNGIEKIQGDVCYSYVPDIIAAVEARGSASAEKLKRFYQFEQDVKVTAHKIETPPCHGFLASTRNYWHHVAANVRAAKLLP